jgi:hypothetical protein
MLLMGFGLPKATLLLETFEKLKAVGALLLIPKAALLMLLNPPAAGCV